MSVSQQHIRRAWKALEKYTPMRKDCGVICASACCKGEADIGMRLVPGEKALLTSDDFTLKTGESGEFCVCSGYCQRHLRPLACRIFPYFPIPIQLRSGRYAIRTMPDARALGVCPLLRNETVEIDRRFLHAVHRAGWKLLKSRRTRAWLLESAEEIQLTAQLQTRLQDSADTAVPAHSN